MTVATYKVSGMTCDHCVQSVKNEVAKLQGVTEVAIDLDSGAVTITSADGVDPSALRAAVDEAGYDLIA